MQLLFQWPQDWILQVFEKLRCSTEKNCNKALKKQAWSRIHLMDLAKLDLPIKKSIYH
jgi:hypothetical protein